MVKAIKFKLDNLAMEMSVMLEQLDKSRVFILGQLSVRISITLSSNKPLFLTIKYSSSGILGNNLAKPEKN